MEKSMELEIKGDLQYLKESADSLQSLKDDIKRDIGDQDYHYSLEDLENYLNRFSL